MIACIVYVLWLGSAFLAGAIYGYGIGKHGAGGKRVDELGLHRWTLRGFWNIRRCAWCDRADYGRRMRQQGHG